MQSYPFIYGFSLGSTSRILYNLKNIDCCYIVYPNNIDHYLSMLIHDQPPYILGLGAYSGIDQNQIRIEKKFSNQFRNGYIEGSDYAELKIQPFLHPSAQMKIANAIGNSYCNLVSWKIAQLTQQKLLSSRYTFLHIPKTMSGKTASKVIDVSLSELLKVKKFESQVR